MAPGPEERQRRAPLAGPLKPLRTARHRRALLASTALVLPDKSTTWRLAPPGKADAAASWPGR